MIPTERLCRDLDALLAENLRLREQAGEMAETIERLAAQVQAAEALLQTSPVRPANPYRATPEGA